MHYERTRLAPQQFDVIATGLPYTVVIDEVDVAQFEIATGDEIALYSGQTCVGAGVYEFRIDFGPGYRIYFGKDGDRLVILLAGGTKKRQDADIAAAKANWRDYKRRKRQEVT